MFICILCEYLNYFYNEHILLLCQKGCLSSLIGKLTHKILANCLVSVIHFYAEGTIIWNCSEELLPTRVSQYLLDISKFCASIAKQRDTNQLMMRKSNSWDEDRARKGFLILRTVFYFPISGCSTQTILRSWFLKYG